MTLLYPYFIGVLLPLFLWFFYKYHPIQTRIHIIILMLLTIAMARPVIAQKAQEREISTHEIIIALDSSYSMQTQDLLPTRFDFAKETIIALLKLSKQDTIMLIAFTSNPLLLSPPTTDHTLITRALQSLNPHFILTKGTSLKKLFKKIHTLQSEAKNIVLLTDGGEEKDFSTISKEISASRLSLITVAIGTQKGSTLIQQNGEYLVDKAKNLVVSRINPHLEKMTTLADGKYLRVSDTPQQTAQTIYSQLTQETHTIKKQHYDNQEWYDLPLVIALILFFLLHTHFNKYLLLFLATFGIDVSAGVWDNYHLYQAYQYYHQSDYNSTQEQLLEIQEPSLQSRLLQANTAYKTTHYEEAILYYLSIRSRSKKIKHTLYYNLGNAYAKRFDYPKAITYYTQALQLADDNDTRYNLQKVIFREHKKELALGKSHPHSQNSSTSTQELTPSKNRDTEEKSSSSGSGEGGENASSDKKKKQEINKLQQESNMPQKLPLSSKVYELINKGYIHETRPW